MIPHRLPAIDAGLCSLCGACAAACPADALAMGSSGPFFAAPENCTFCGDCETLCPSAAIRCEYYIVWGPQSGSHKHTFTTP